ncbi:MAG: flagellar biosynthesis protein FlhF [Phycisphaerales bacterium]
MALKVYRARTMQDALSEVKRDLGQDAVILHTRSYRSRGLLGLGGRNIVEITATADANPSTRPVARSARRGAPAAQPGIEPVADAQDPQQTRAASVRAAAASRAYGKLSAAPAPSPAPFELALEAAAGPPPASSASPPSSVAEEPVHIDSPQPRLMRVASPRRDDAPPRLSDGGGMEDELRSIKRMMTRLLQSQSGGGGIGAMSDPLFTHYLRLQENAVAVEIADEIVGRVRDELSLAELSDEEIVRETVLREIAALLPVASEPTSRKRPADGRPLTVALIGPTGVGKTTTVAKLAATSKLRHGRSVGLITTDTYRIAAVEQLRTYADIIGLPIRVVSSPSEMRPAIEALGELDEILIDTAGRSQHDEERLTELRGYLDEADPHETHLVLSSVASEAVLMRSAESFGRLEPNRVIFTKLDEAVNTGVLLAVVRRVGVALSFVTTGQEVPDHIEPGRSDRLARMILTGRLPA